MSCAFPSPGHQLTMLEGGAVQTGLHLPLLPALKMVAISSGVRTRPKNSSSSILPLKAKHGVPEHSCAPINVLTEVSLGAPPLSLSPFGLDGCNTPST